MYTESLRHLKRATSIVLLASFLTFIMGPIPTARAASLTGLSDTMSSIKASTAANHTIQFTTPTGVASGQTITITFPAGFDLSTNSVDFEDVDVTVGGTDVAIAATATGATWGAAVALQVLTLTNGTTAVAPGSVIVVEIGTNATFGVNGAGQIINPTAGDQIIDIAGTFTDTGSITVTILTDDQVAVTAEVGQSVTFSISDFSIAFGTLSGSAPRFATTGTGSGTETEAHTLSAGTNASGGYTITVAGPTLTAGNGTDTITAIGGTAQASSTGNEQFGMRLVVTSGTGTVSGPYNTANFAYDGEAAADIVASTIGSSATTVYSARYLANISAQTEAGNYSTALTYVATANF